MDAANQTPWVRLPSLTLAQRGPRHLGDGHVADAQSDRCADDAVPLDRLLDDRLGVGETIGDDSSHGQAGQDEDSGAQAAAPSPEPAARDIRGAHDVAAGVGDAAGLGVAPGLTHGGLTSTGRRRCAVGVGSSQPV